MAYFKHLTKNALVYYQSFGHFDEHLASFYSLAYGKPYIYKNTYLTYFDSFSKLLHLSLFELNEKENDFSYIEKAVKTFKPERIVITTPHELPLSIGLFECVKINQDTDYQIYVPNFDLSLKGSNLSDGRYRVRNAEKRGYKIQISKKMTLPIFTLLHSINIQNN